MRRILRLTAGVLCLLLGIAGLFLPFLQGFLLIFLGLSLLSPGLAARFRREFLLRWGPRAWRDAPMLRLEEWDRLGARAGFTTRTFPAHLASTDDLDREDARAAVRLVVAGPGRFAYLKQVHGAAVAHADGARFKTRDFSRAFDADALVTVDRGTALLVLSADCLPVFYAALRNGKAAAVAVAHAGWRGTKEKIAVRALEKLKEISGVPASGIRVAFGPRIDFKNYEVGQEFRQHFPVKKIGEKWYFDLAAENRRQLLDAGVPRRHILDTRLSTVAHNRFFYSSRLEKGAAGRTVSFIFIP